MISQATIEKVNDIKLSSVIQAFLGTNLKKNGANYTAKCPFHNDTHASLTVNDAKDVWKCFACGEGGKGGISFVMKHEKTDFPQAIRKIGASFNIAIVDEPNGRNDSEEYKAKKAKKLGTLAMLDLAATHFQQQFKANLKGEVGDYLNLRAFSEETLTAFGIGYASDSDHFTSYTSYSLDELVEACLCTSKDSPKDFFRNRLIFPLHDLVGKIVGFAGRELPPAKSKMKYLNSRDSDIYKKSEILYGYHIARKLLKKDNPIYLCEGYTNVMRLFENGLPALASGGISLSETQIDHISKLTQNIVLLLDGDEAGRNATLRYIPLFLQKGFKVRVCLMPEGEDIDSIGKQLKEFQYCFKSINPYKNLQDYISIHTVDWLDYKVSLLNGAKLSPEEESEFTQHLCELILSIPDVVQRKLWVKELKFYFTDIMQTYKDVRLANKETKTVEVQRETVTIAEDGSGIQILGYDIANFSLKVIYIIDLKLDRKNGKQKYEWVFEIWQKNKEPHILYVPSDDFATGAAFHKFLAPLGYSYRATEEHHKLLIENLNKALIRTKDINRVGWNKEANLFFFSNAAFLPGETSPLIPDFTSTVIHEEKGYRMMHYKDAQEGKESPEYREFFFQKSEVSLLQVATLIQIAWEEKAILSLCHAISTAFFDVITRVTRCFPIFYAWSAKPSTGKSTLCEFNTAFFGRNRKKSIASENTSIAGLSRVMQNCCNTVVLLDELKRNKSLLAKIDILQQFYDLKGHTITDSRDFDSEFTFEVNTGTYVTANFLPLEPQHKAFRTRLLIYELNPSKSKESYEAYKDISRLMDGNLSQIMVDIIQHRPLIEAEFRTVFDEIQHKMREKMLPDYPNMEERLFTNAAILLTPTLILLRHNCIELPVNEAELFGFTCEMLASQSEEETEINPLYNFWLAVNEAYLERKLRMVTHFKICKDKEGQSLLIKFRFDKFYRQYKDSHKGLGGGELLQDYDLKSQLKRSPAFVDWISSERFARDEEDILEYKQKKGVRFPPKERSTTTSCFLMNYELLKKEFPLELDIAV